jgi:hypothetical protein
MQASHTSAAGSRTASIDRLYQLSDQVNEQDRERLIATIPKRVPLPNRAEYEFCHRSVRGKFGVTSPLPAPPCTSCERIFSTIDRSHSDRLKAG